MSNTKKLLLLMLIAVVIIIAIIVCILFYQNRGKIIYGVDEIGDEFQYNIDEKVKRVTNRSDFYAVETCVNKFYLYYAEMYNTDEEESLDEFTKGALYDILDTEYISYKQITKNNISEKLKKINTQVVNITDMYISEKTRNVSVYIVQGSLREKITGEISSFKTIVKLDTLNRTFSVLPQDYVEERYSNIKEGETIDINVTESIESNEYNMYDLTIISEETYVNDLISKFKEEILYNAELAYNNLNEEYRNKRFNTIEDFKQYARSNIRRYVIMKIEKYQKTQTSEYTQYVCIDKEGKYYIFRETAPMKYTLLLDTYTIDIPEFIDRYDKSNPQERVILNLNKFLLSINDKNYKYAYSVLADSFKQKNFKTQEEFENYIKSNFFEKNEFSYEKFGNEANTYYTYEVKITDSSNELSSPKTKTFIVLLEEGRDFKLSFNI